MNTELESTQSINTQTSSTHQDDLPMESAEALIASMKSVVLDETSLHIQVEREMLPARKEGSKNLSMFVVTMPRSATPAQRVEADYWLREIGPLFRYAHDKVYYA